MFSHSEAKRWEKKNQTAKEKKITCGLKRASSNKVSTAASRKELIHRSRQCGRVIKPREIWAFHKESEQGTCVTSSLRENLKRLNFRYSNNFFLRIYLTI